MWSQFVYLEIGIWRSPTVNKLYPTPARYGVIQANAPGIIDAAYCGDGDELKLQLFTISEGEIPAGARIAQMRIFPKQNVELEQVETLGNPNRGGFGSTGR